MNFKPVNQSQKSTKYYAQTKNRGVKQILRRIFKIKQFQIKNISASHEWFHQTSWKMEE